MRDDLCRVDNSALPLSQQLFNPFGGTNMMSHLSRGVGPATVIAIAVIAAAVRADEHGKANRYVVTPLTSNLANGAPNQDPVLQNAWGVAFTPGASPFWVADNASGCATLYDGTGVPAGGPPPLKVAIPLPEGNPSATSCMPVPPPNSNPPPNNAAPTGMVWNPTTGSTGFTVPSTSITAAFIWATEDGTISAWASTLPDTSHAVEAVNNSPDAVYKGLAVGTNTHGVFLYATDFRGAKIDVFAPPDFSPASSTQIPGSFSDPDIPAGFAPFGIQNINGNLFVTYALQKQPDKHDDMAGPGNGFVDIFDTDGNLLRRFASRGTLNSPWGVSRASFAFGRFSGDILIGNFGDGKITAFKSDGDFHGLLRDATTKKPLAIDGLWTITLGGGRNSNSDTLYFTAGPNGEVDGLFGTITPGPGKGDDDN
jgi:uncharacterized protein (TIGR03118 family)